MKLMRECCAVSLKTDEDMKECVCVLLAASRLAAELSCIFSESFSFYNGLLLMGGSSVKISLAHGELALRGVYESFDKAYGAEKRLEKSAAGSGGPWYLLGHFWKSGLFVPWAWSSRAPAQKSASWKMHLCRKSLLLKEKALEMLAVYLSRNIVEPFDRLFVEISQNNERDLSEELGLQCKLVVDRKIGKYLEKNSILGWPLAQVRGVLCAKLEKLQKEYQEVSLEIKKSLEVEGLQKLFAPPEVKSIAEDFRAVMQEMLHSA